MSLKTKVLARERGARRVFWWAVVRVAWVEGGRVEGLGIRAEGERGRVR